MFSQSARGFHEKKVAAGKGAVKRSVPGVDHVIQTEAIVVHNVHQVPWRCALDVSIQTPELNQAHLEVPQNIPGAQKCLPFAALEIEFQQIGHHFYFLGNHIQGFDLNIDLFFGGPLNVVEKG